MTADRNAQQKSMFLRGEADAWFISLTEGMQLRRPPERPNVILWDGLVNGERVTLFDRELENGCVCCNWSFV